MTAVMNASRSTQCFFLEINLDKTQETFTANVFTCVLNSIFSLITCLGNSVILHAIRKSAELHSPSFALLYCLATSDLLVGLVCQPFLVAYKIAELLDNSRAYCTLRMFQSISSWISSGVSLLTLTAVSPSSSNSSFTIQHDRYHTSGVPNSLSSLDLFNYSCYVIKV